jgi:putative membrane protein
MIELAHGAPASAWTWVPHPDVWLLLGALGGGYVAALYLLGPRLLPYGEAPATTRHQLLFCAGLTTLWIGADWPVHDLSEDFLLSVHMIQHLLFTFVAPPLILLGLPSWLLRTLLRPRALMAVVRFLTRPLVALVLFNGVIAVTHWPLLVNASLSSELVHFGIHVLLFLSAAIMWWPVVDPFPETATLEPAAKMFYLFLQSILPTVPASFLTFSDRPIYSFYADAPRLWQWLDPVTDQRVAGLMMKILGGLILWGVIAVVFFRWNAREEARDRGEIPWDDFERELESYNLRP